jgi:perosamine synthetase
VLQWTDVLCDARDRVQSAMTEHGIDSRAFWLPIHRQKPYELAEDSFPVANQISRDGLWLPSSFDLTYEQVRTVSEVIRGVAS